MPPKRLHVLLLIPAVMASCAAPPPASPTVADAWQGRAERTADTPQRAEPLPAAAATPARSRSASNEKPLATINGRPLSYDRFVDLLFRSRGAELLEQFIVLEAAEGLAAQRNLAVTESDIDAEFDSALRTLAQGPGKSFNRAEAEALLDSVLAQRKVSREEFMLGMRRNALLRKLADQEHVVTDDELQSEFTRRYGPRVRVATISVHTLSDAPRLRRRLQSAENGDAEGTPAIESLGPFSEAHDEIPALIRRTAFALQPGQISDLLHMESGSIFLRVQERILGDPEKTLESVRGELEVAVRQRQVQKALAALYERLFREADVKINEPTLKESFKRSYPSR